MYDISLEQMKKHVFRIHIIQRMFSSRITVDEVIHVINTGTVIEAYPEDIPYPSRLILGWSGARPLHVVAYNQPEDEEIIITVYEPDPDQWETGFSRRKP